VSQTTDDAVTTVQNNADAAAVASAQNMNSQLDMISNDSSMDMDADVDSIMDMDSNAIDMVPPLIVSDEMQYDVVTSPCTREHLLVVGYVNDLLRQLSSDGISLFDGAVCGIIERYYVE